MYKNKNILRGAVVLFIVAVMFFSSVAVANTKSKTQLEPFGKGQGTGPEENRPISNRDGQGGKEKHPRGGYGSPAAPGVCPHLAGDRKQRDRIFNAAA